MSVSEVLSERMVEVEKEEENEGDSRSLLSKQNKIRKTKVPKRGIYVFQYLIHGPSLLYY